MRQILKRRYFLKKSIWFIPQDSLKYERFFSKEEYDAHKKAQVGTAFLSGKFHKVLFDKNVYLTEKDGPVNREMSRSKSDPSIKPFKPSSPPKTVSFFYFSLNFLFKVLLKKNF